jgi:dihydroflavonol-4-reductase
MKAFVTGPTGFLGITLLRELAAEGWDIFAFHRSTSDLTDLRDIPRVTYVVGDVRDKASVQRAMPEGVDAVFHTAGSVGFLKPGDEKEQYDINELGTRNVVETALEKRIGRFICTSTVLTYDYRDGRPVTEESPPNDDPRFSYIHSKYLGEKAAERAVAEQGLDAVFLHPSAIFGAYDKATWSKMFREVQRGLRVPLAPPGKASVCHMLKVARAHVSAYHRGRKGEHYLLGGVDASMMEIATAIARILGKPGPLVVVPPTLFKVLGRLEYHVSTLLRREPMVTPSMADILCETVLCDSSKAVRELGYEPSSLETMLLDCHQWMVRTGMLPPKNVP